MNWANILRKRLFRPTCSTLVGIVVAVTASGAVAVGEELALSDIDSWSKLTPNWKLCVDLSLQKNDETIESMEEQGVSPHDPQVSSVMTSCDSFIRRPMKTGVSCIIEGEQSICDEAYFLDVKRISLAEAIKVSIAGQLVTVNLFETDEGQAQRLANRVLEDLCFGRKLDTPEKALQACQTAKFPERILPNVRDQAAYWADALRCLSGQGTADQRYQVCSLVNEPKHTRWRPSGSFKTDVSSRLLASTVDLASAEKESWARNAWLYKAYNLADALVANGNVNEFVLVLRGNLVLALLKDDPGTSIRASRSNAQNKQIAIESYRSALALNPNSEAAKSGLQRALQ